MEGSWSWHDCSPGLARYFLPLVHFSAVLCELILAREAITFSMILASDHRALEFGGILAVHAGSVADEVRPTARAETAILDSAAEGGSGIFEILPVMGLLMHSAILCNTKDPASLASRKGAWIPFIPFTTPATIKITRSVFMTFLVNDTYSKTHHAGTFRDGAYAR